jgi:predicted nucleic acid-binding protein
MNVVFADTFYFLGLTNPGDHVHARCVRFARQYRGDFITTSAILLEYANAASKPPYRRRAAAFLDSLSADPRVKIVPLTSALFDRGCALYRQHVDKEWSLTDCISFITMRDEGIVEAATGDRHFEQAGFGALLK